MMATGSAAMAMKLLIWGVMTMPIIDMPPRKYDHPYPNIKYVMDFPLETQDGDIWWGFTEPPLKRGGVCIVHLSPIGSVRGSQVMTEEGLQALVRHETAHCNGWRHAGTAQTGR
jgi:hypothetical protein